MSSSGTGTSAPPSPPPTEPTPGSSPPPAPEGIQRQKRRGSWVIPVVAVIVIIVVIVAVGFAAGWFKSSTSSSSKYSCTAVTSGATLPSPGTIKGEGSSLVEPLIDQWETSYWTGSVVTAYNPAGSSSGISAITLKVVDFGASDAPLTNTQLAAAPGLLEVPEAAGGVVPIYNLAGITHLHFNGSVLAQIFDGQITNWNNTALQSLNPGVTLPSASIAPVYRTGGSGTTFIFTSFLTLKNSYWASHYGRNLSWPSGLPGTSASGNGGEASTVSTTPDAIGYVDIEYALTSSASLGIGAVQNPTGNFIVANVTNTESALVDLHPTLPSGSESWYNVSFLDAPGAGDYPITSLTYLLVYQDLSSAYSSYTLNSAENLVDFIQWAITTGQSWSPKLSYAPLPGFVLTVDNATLSSMMFDGSAVPICVVNGGGAPT